mgnify:CR=1 FL=1
MKYIVLIFGMLASASLVAAEIVKVGVYDFPPYAFVDKKASGIAIQMMEEMNKFQDKYEFVPVLTTSKRRYRDFKAKKFDMVFFESKNWGWQDLPVDASVPFVTGFEVYVTQSKPGRGQEFFSDFKNKAMIGVLGYHYQFANFKTDHGYLKENFNLIQTDGQEKSLELILKGRGEIAVISKEYLNYHFLSKPANKNMLLISDKYDQIYRHTILVRKNYTPTVDYLNNLLMQMEKSRVLTPLWQKYGLEVATPLSAQKN